MSENFYWLCFLPVFSPKRVQARRVLPKCLLSLSTKLLKRGVTRLATVWPSTTHTMVIAVINCESLYCLFLAVAATLSLICPAHCNCSRATLLSFPARWWNSRGMIQQSVATVLASLPWHYPWSCCTTPPLQLSHQPHPHHIPPSTDFTLESHPA